MNALRITLCSLLLLIATAPLMAQGTYTQIDYPGATETYCYGISMQACSTAAQASHSQGNNH